MDMDRQRPYGRCPPFPFNLRVIYHEDILAGDPFKVVDLIYRKCAIFFKTVNDVHRIIITGKYLDIRFE